MFINTLEGHSANGKSPVVFRHIQETPDKNGKSLVGIEIDTLVSHDGQPITFAVGYNRIGNLRGQGDLHGHRRLPPRYSNDFAKHVSGNILGAIIER